MRAAALQVNSVLTVRNSRALGMKQLLPKPSQEDAAQLAGESAEPVAHRLSFESQNAFTSGEVAIQ